MAKRKPPKAANGARNPAKTRESGRNPGLSPRQGPRRGPREGGGRQNPGDRNPGGAGRAPAGGPVWLFGAHAVLAALANPHRRGQRLLLSPEAERRLGARIQASRTAGARCPAPESARRETIDQVLSAEAVHQGLAYLVEPLTPTDLSQVLAAALAPPSASAVAAEGRTRPLIVVLDQVTDPQNVGAILRSAAAFGAAAVVAPARHAAPESGALAKAASGALEVVPYLAVANLARALARMKDSGFWILGLAGDSEKTLEAADPGGPLVLVLGAEGPGLRRLTRDSCDLLARLPTRPPIESLNVSTAAAVALYALMSKII